MSTAQAILYRCPHCQHAIEVDEALIDDHINCPNPDCGRPFHLEAPDGMVVSKSQLKDETVIDLRSNSEDPEADGIGNAAENVLETLHPSMFRAHPLKFLGLSIALIFGVIGMVTWLVSEAGLVLGGETWLTPTPLLWMSILLTLLGGGWMFVWWLQTIYVTLTITTVRSMLNRGLISRQTSEVRHTDVRNIQVDQNIWERIVGVGDIAISSAGQDDLEIDVDGLPHPNRVADRIREMQ